MKVKMKIAQSCQLFANPWTVHGILQARILEWVAFPFSRGSSQPRDRTQVSRIAGGFFTSWAIREALNLHILKGNVDHGPSLTGKSWEWKGRTALDVCKLYGNLYVRSSSSSHSTGTKNKNHTVKSHQVKWIPSVRPCFTLNLRPSSFEG